MQQQQQETPALSIPEIAACKGHINQECAAKKCAASMARLCLANKVLDAYRKAEDSNFVMPLPSGLGYLGQTLSPTDPLVLHLLDLCRSDILCCQRWFISPPPQLDPPSDFDKATFTRLLILFADNQLYSPDGTLVTVPAWENDAVLSAGALSDPPTATALSTLSDAYWLLLLRMAVFCNGRPNQFFLLGHGCTCVPGAVCSEADGSFETSEFVALSILLAVCLFVVCWWFWQAIQDLLQTTRILSQVLQAITITRAMPTVDLGFEPRKEETRKGPATIGDEFALWWHTGQKSKEQ